MSFMANPSIPSLPASTQVEVKTAITNIANWINLFNKSLGDVVGTSSSTVDSSYYSSALYKFVESTLLGDQAVANIIKKLEGELTETQLHKDLVDRINLIDDPNTGLPTKASVTQLTNAITTLDTALSQDITQLSTTVDNNTSSIETLAQVTDGIQAEYTVKLNTNSKVAGFGLMLSENEPSTFEIVADKFAIVNYDGVTSTVPFQVTGGVTILKSALIGELAADKITSGYLRAINISTGTAANSVKFYEEGYTSVPLHSSAYSGIYWNGWVGTSILTTSDLYFGHNNISLPINRRVRSGTVKVFMLWTGVTDSAMSIYYRINGGSWICVAEGSDSQPDYGAASTSWIGDVTIPVNGSIEFGMRPTSCSGWYYNGDKLEMRTTNFTIQMVNF